MSRNEIRNRVMRLLEVPPEPLCDNCIEQVLGYPEKTVNPINNRLMAEGWLDRGRGYCNVCKKTTNLVNLWRSGS